MLNDRSRSRRSSNDSEGQADQMGIRSADTVLGVRSNNNKIAKEIYQSLGRMPDEGLKIPEYFNVLETYLKQRKIENVNEEWLNILRSLIGFHGNKIILGLPLEGTNYVEVKQAIFCYYGISPKLYYDNSM